MKSRLVVFIVSGVFWTFMIGAAFAQQANLLPNSLGFWENSAHWTTNFGPAFRDTVEGVSYFLPCTAQFALCFHSGAAPDAAPRTRPGDLRSAFARSIKR